MKMTPLFPRIVIDRIPTAAKVGGIVIPNAMQEESLQGVVVAAFEGCDLKIGTTIIYARLSGDPIKYDNKDYLIMDYTPENVLAIVEHEKESK